MWVFGRCGERLCTPAAGGGGWGGGAGADYVVFGSVWETASHPGGGAAGLERLREVCEISPVPVYAIGGVTAERVAACLEAGAHGVAVMRAVWEAEDVESATRELVE